MSLDFLYTAVSWVLLRWHQLFSAIGLPPGNWALSIVLLVITVRLLLVPLFIRQVHHQRRLQQLQPKIAALRERHRDDRAAQQRALLKLQQELMLYGVPASVLISGLVFPLGVLLSWLTSNVWTLAQQAYVNRFHPPGPPASPERRTVAQG